MVNVPPDFCRTVNYNDHCRRTAIFITAALFLCAVLGAVVVRFASILAPLTLVFALFAIPVDEAQADYGHQGGNYPLHCAVVNGDLAAVVHLLGSAHKINVTVNAQDLDPVVGGNRVRCTIPRGGFSGPVLTPPLLHAASRGYATIAATLIAAGADVNGKDVSTGSKGYTPLHAAAQNNRISAISVLIAAGAEINAKDNRGDTPLHVAAQNNRISAISVLIAAGAEVNAKNKNRNTPLRETCTSAGVCHSNGVSLRAVLIAAGGHWGGNCVKLANVNPAGPTTPCLCEYPNVGTAWNCRAPSVESCATYAPPRFYDATAGACSGNLYPCHDSAIRKADNSGCECPKETFAHDPSGGTWEPFCEHNFYFPGGSNCQRWGKPRISIPISAECLAGHAPIPHNLNGWLPAVFANNPTLVAHFIFGHGQDPDGENYELHSAVSLGYHSAAKALIEGGADIDRKRSGDTPLHSAIENRRGPLITLLLQRGADADAKDDDGDTALHLAARRPDTAENAGLIAFLLDKGADPNVFNDRRWRPLDLADGRDGYPRRRKIMAALITGGANWSDECVGGKTPNEYTPPKCKCPPHLSIDNNGLCECPAHSHSQINGRCLPKDSAQVDAEVLKMETELLHLRAALVSLNARLSAAAEMPREMVEEIAEQAGETAQEIKRRRDNFVALARADLAGAPPPPVAMSDTAAECRMLGGEVQIHSATGIRICSGIDSNDTFCLVDSGDAYPCRGLFRHVRRCNDDYNRRALNPFFCGPKCGTQKSVGKDCAAP